MKRILPGLLTLLVATPAPAQDGGAGALPRVREALHLLEAWVDAQRAYEQIPGISMAVVHDQELLWAGGFGHADLEDGQPATPGTLYSICSISKLFTSVAVLQLRDAGALRLDDPVARHLPWYDIRDEYPDAPPVTVEGILTHSSGLPRESGYPYWSAPDFDFPTRDQIRDRLSEQAELYPAFRYHQYSNLGLTLAGEVVAELSGRPYDDYVREEILEPLGLQSTYPEIPLREHGEGMARGYAALTREGTRPPVKAFQARGIAPAAGYASTVQDLARFASWQFRVLESGGDEVLGRNTLREMYRVHWLDPDWDTKWGLGFATWREDDRTYVGHGGSCPGYRSHLNLDPESRVATIFMANASGVNSGRFTRRAQAIVGPAIREAADTAESLQAADWTLAPYLGTYSAAPWGGETEVLLWKGGLAAVSFPTDDPLASLTRFRKTGEHTFRRIRDDDALGEEIRFEMGPDGRAARMWRHSNFSPRMR